MNVYDFCMRMYKVNNITIHCHWDNENGDILYHKYIFTDGTDLELFKLRNFKVTMFEVNKRNSVIIHASDFKY